MKIEEVILSRQLEMNNHWPNVFEVETEPLNILKQYISNNGNIFVSAQVDKEAAMQTLICDKHLAKTFSSMLDLYDLLPYHPDIAFDVSWRALEYIMKLYAHRAWGEGADMKLDKLFEKFSIEVFESLIRAEKGFCMAFEQLANNVSMSALQYLTTRMYFEKQITVAPQISFVKGRVYNILDKERVQALYNAYVEDDTLPTMAVRNIARRFSRLLQGQDVTFEKGKISVLSLNKRIEFLLSLVLYTSRCERFHGDLYSPFKSSKAKLTTYYEYYYLVLCCYVFFWIVMFKLVEREKGLMQFVVPQNVGVAVKSTIGNMNNVFKNKM